ncbi:MAG: alpha/beta hydrolase [Lachnospiraceae bacterium]|nr:alpha/beta hydrolase [Lachnospiraceae bacterium]MDD3616394.1 alpha/beta hydrolase [Lachnospiraceae bacterium]
MAFEKYKKLFEIYDREVSDKAQKFFEFEGEPEPESVGEFNKKRIIYQRDVMRNGAPLPDVERMPDFEYKNGDYTGKISVYKPKGKTGDIPAVVYIHGGGWFNLNKECYDYECSEIALESECIVFSIEYRMALGGVKLPTPFEDVFAAYVEIEKRAASYGAKYDQVVLVGDSAGGNMVLGLDIYFREKQGPKIIQQILYYPNIGFECEDDVPNVNLPATIFPEEGKSELIKQPYISPIYDQQKEMMPPTMLIMGTCDFLLDDILRYANALIQAGVDVDIRLFQGMPHGFIHMGNKPGADSIRCVSEKIKAVYGM